MATRACTAIWRARCLPPAPTRLWPVPTSAAAAMALWWACAMPTPTDFPSPATDLCQRCTYSNISFFLRWLVIVNSAPLVFVHCVLIRLIFPTFLCHNSLYNAPGACTVPAEFNSFLNNNCIRGSTLKSYSFNYPEVKCARFVVFPTQRIVLSCMYKCSSRPHFSFSDDIHDFVSLFFCHCFFLYLFIRLCFTTMPPAVSPTRPRPSPLLLLVWLWPSTPPTTRSPRSGTTGTYS